MEDKQTPVEAQPEEQAVQETDGAQEVSHETEQPQEQNVVYTLPDGTEATGEQLKEMYVNLQSDYTKKSQIAATIQQQQPAQEVQPVQTQEEEDPFVSGLLQAAEQRVFAKMEAQKQAEVDRQKQIESYVESEVSELKKLDPNVDANEVMFHAAKYGFPSLLKAYENFKDMTQTEKLVEERALKNAQKRDQNPVSEGSNVAPSAPIKFPEGMSMEEKVRYQLQQLKT